MPEKSRAIKKFDYRDMGTQSKADDKIEMHCDRNKLKEGHKR